MKRFEDIIEKVISIIKETEVVPVDAVYEYRGSLMNMPLHDPTVTVGIRDVTLETGSLRAYGGILNGVAEYSIPAEIEICANIHIPKDASGVICYNVLSDMANGLFYNEDLNVYKINSGKMSYNSTFLCSVLPVSIFIRDRLCGNSVGG